MKHVRVLLAVLVAMLFVAPATQAQGGGGGRGGRGGGALTALMANITLSADQQAKYDSITTHYREERQAMMQGGGGMGGMDSTTRAKMTEMTNKQYDDIRKILTEDQQKVFDENRKNLPQGRRGGGTGSR